MSTEFYFPSRTSRRWLRVGPLAGDLDNRIEPVPPSG